MMQYDRFIQKCMHYKHKIEAINPEHILGMLNDRRTLISKNTKTGYSLNFSLLSCQDVSSPTCRKYCYAKGGHFQCDHVVRAMIERELVFQ